MNMTTEQIIDALAPFIVDRRLTGELYVDDVLVIDPAEIEPGRDQPYDEYGFSLEMSEHGAVKIKAVEDTREEFAVSEDPYKRQVATEQNPWFCLMVKGRDYPPEQLKQISANHQKYFFLPGPFMGRFNLFGDRYRHMDTGETTNRIPSAERKTRKWKTNPDYIGATVPLHVGLGFGNGLYPKWPTWEESVQELTSEAVRKMHGAVAALRHQAENPGAPKAGPGR